MKLEPRIKSFIEEFIHLIETNNFDTLYQQAAKYLSKSEIHLLTESLIHPDVNIQVLSNMYYVPKYYLADNTSITSIELPDSITAIYSHAFAKCFNLKEIILPESITWVDGYAFYNCFNLEKLVVNNKETSMSLTALNPSRNLTVYCKPGAKVEKLAVNAWKASVVYI